MRHMQAGPVAPRVARPGRQRGQALTEMAIVAVVLVPLLLLVSTFGKYIHIKQTAQQAARSAAWQATVTPNYVWNDLQNGRANQRKLVLDRHFGKSTDRITSTASAAAENDRVGNVMMNSYSNEGLLRRSDVTMGEFQNSDAGVLATIIGGFGELFEKLPGEFPPNKDGKVTEAFTIRPRNIGTDSPYLSDFSNINLEMKVSHTVFADSWSAAGSGLEDHPSHGHDRGMIKQVKSLSPMSHLAPVSDVLDNLGFLEAVPGIGVVTRLRPGYVQPDIVPVRRLKPYAPN